MKAMVYTEYGPPDVLQLKEVETPSPRDNEVLVKVHAASVNSWDQDLLTGKPYAYRMFGIRKPKLRTFGADIAGRVEAVGKDVKRFRPGDEVFGDLSGSGWGGFAEYVSPREDALEKKPAGMTFEQAAALPQAGVMALQGVRDMRTIRPGDTVLMNGGAGGVGTIAIQIAKSMGAEVTGVDGTPKLDLMRSLGADHVIDFTKNDFIRSGKHYDLILDVAAHYSVFDYRRTLNPGGVYAMIGGAPSSIFPVLLFGAVFSKFGDKKVRMLMHVPNKDLAHLAELVVSGTLKPVIDRRYPLSELPDAMRYFGEGRVQGKVIITMETQN